MPAFKCCVGWTPPSQNTEQVCRARMHTRIVSSKDARILLGNAQTPCTRNERTRNVAQAQAPLHAKQLSGGEGGTFVRAGDSQTTRPTRRRCAARMGTRQGQQGNVPRGS